MCSEGPAISFHSSRQRSLANKPFTDVVDTLSFPSVNYRFFSFSNQIDDFFYRQRVIEKDCTELTNTRKSSSMFCEPRFPYLFSLTILLYSAGPAVLRSVWYHPRHSADLKVLYFLLLKPTELAEVVGWRPGPGPLWRATPTNTQRIFIFLFFTSAQFTHFFSTFFFAAE